jgi:formylglycine-generating enzyme required for sulfatase activity
MRVLLTIFMIPVVLLVGGCTSNPADSISAPVITQQPQSRTVIVGQSMTFTVTAKGNPAPTYQWRKYGTNITGTSGSYNISSVQINDAGTYSVVVSNSVGSDTSNGAILTVYPAVTPSGMVSIPGGTFQMGSTALDSFTTIELPLHDVTISAFYMDRTEVTRADYCSLMGAHTSGYIGDSLYPAENMTWFDAVLYCNARSKRDGKDTVYTFTSITMVSWPEICCSDLVGLAMDFSKNGYRLPTEAEWEYVCRAGSTTEYYWGGGYPLATPADTAVIDNNAVWRHNSHYGPERVGTKLPNAWGLYDMSGNVEEYTNDWSGIYSSGAQTDPTGPSSGGPYPFKIARGGSFDEFGEGLRSAMRVAAAPDSPWSQIGFRCARR